MPNVLIKNFRNIEDVKLPIRGITALVGQSNNGKTAIFQAIRTLVYNIQGTDYIRRVGPVTVPDGVTIGIQFDSNLTIYFKKINSPIFRLKFKDKDVLFQKVGRGDPPSDIVKLINMEPLEVDNNKYYLNFQQQLESPLLMGLSPYAIYSITIKSFDGEKIQQAIKLAKQDIEIAEVSLNTKKIEIQTQQRNKLRILSKLDLFQGIEVISEGYYKYVKNLDKIVSGKSLLVKINVISSKINNIVSLIKEVDDSNLSLKLSEAESFIDKYSKGFKLNESLQSYEKKLEWNKKILEAFKALDKIDVVKFESLSTKHKLLSESSIRIIAIDRDITGFEERINVFKELETIVKWIEASEKMALAKAMLERLRQKASDLQQSIDIKDTNISETQKHIDTLQNKIDNKDFVCSQCGQKLQEIPQEMIDEIKERIKTLETKKQQYVGQKEVLVKEKIATIKLIKDAGFDPEKLDIQLKDLDTQVTKFQTDSLPILEKIETKVVEFEKEQESEVTNT